MWSAWEGITGAADRFLETIGEEDLSRRFERKGRPFREDIGTQLLRNTYHYWFHIGEAHAVRQQLGHQNLPQFVGDLSAAAWR